MYPAMINELKLIRLQIAIFSAVAVKCLRSWIFVDSIKNADKIIGCNCAVLLLDRVLIVVNRCGVIRACECVFNWSGEHNKH